MIGAVLVIVLMPGTWQEGREQHVPFETMALCEKALPGFLIEGRDGWKYCTTPNNAVWFYPHEENRR